MLHRIFTRAVAPGLILALPACSPPATPPGDALIRLSDDEVKGLDPQKISDLTSLRVAADQFEGLMRYRGDGGTEPGLASASICSRDAMTCRYTLRAGVVFSDGTPITAMAFAKGFARLRDPATAAPTARLFDAVADVATTDPRTVVIRLRRPFPALPHLLAHPAMAALPLHRIDAVGARWTSERPLVTSGAYRLSEWRLGDRLVLERNPRWHDRAAPSPRIVWQAAEDKLAALRRFANGAVDTVSDIPATRVGRARTQLPGAVRIAPYAGTYYLAFNTRKPPFDDVRVRRALSLAVDRAWIAERLLATGETPATGVVPPVIGGTIPVATRPAPPEQIRALLAAAGYGPDRPLAFDLRFNSGGDHRRIAVALAAMWRPFGIEARAFNTEATLHFAALRSGDFALARSGWIADLPVPENFLAVHAGDAGVINYSGFADPHYDALFAKALGETDPAARAAAMRAADAILSRDVPVLPLYHYVSRSLVATDIGGWQDNAMNIHPSRLLYRRGRPR